MTITIPQPILGLNNLVDVGDLDPREAATGSENVLFTNGVIKTPYGFSSFDITTGLNSGDQIIYLGKYRELDRTDHIIAVTTEKIFRHDSVNDTWSDITQSGLTMSSLLGTPVSMAAIAHTDTNIYLNDNVLNALAFYHAIVCDGGLSNIQRWAGKYEDDFADLLGGDGYHDGTTHRALHVGEFQSRLILLSPKEYSSSSGGWTDYNQRVRWPVVGKLQTWTGTGSGYSDLIDTGGTNVWAERLGGLYIVYQNNSIWDLRYVGGTDVFSPYPIMEDIGLLSNHLIVSKRNVHYFVSDDFNVYEYYGGTVKRPIGDKIKDLLHADMDPQYNNRGWMVVGAQNKRLWIFVVPNGSIYVTKAYGYDIQNQSWTVRDYTDLFNANHGITAVSLVGAGSYTTGETYNEALGHISVYDISDAGDATQRYGDVLQDVSRTQTVDSTEAAWCAGGLEFYCACADVTYSADFTKGDILKVIDGSDSVNTRYGDHFYTIENVYSNCVYLDPRDDSQAVADSDTNVPASVCFEVWTDDGPTYSQVVTTVLTTERMVLGDDSGYVYQYSNSLVTQEGENITCRYLTKVYDFEEPGKQKRWPGLWVVAKEKTSGNGQLVVKYRTKNFDTSETGWATFTARDLTSSYKKYRFRTNTKSYEIQYMFTNTSGSDFEIREYNLMDPVELVDR